MSSSFFNFYFLFGNLTSYSPITHLPVFPCLLPVHYDLPTTKKRQVHSVLPIYAWYMVNFLMASPPKEDSFSACIHTRNYQLRKALQWPEWGGTNWPTPILLPALQCCWWGVGQALSHSWTLTWLQTSTLTTGICMGFCGNWIRATELNMTIVHIRTSDPLMALNCCMDHEPQHSLRWLHMPLTSTWCTEATKP